MPRPRRLTQTFTEFQYDPVAEYLAAMYYCSRRDLKEEPPKESGLARAFEDVKQNVGSLGIALDTSPSNVFPDTTAGAP